MTFDKQSVSPYLFVLEMFFKKFFPSVRAEDEEDPRDELKRECTDNHKEIQELLEKYEACNERVRSKKKTNEKCIEELYDYVEALDHCIHKTLFSKLK